MDIQNNFFANSTYHHGYDKGACQWLLDPKYQNISDTQVQTELVEHFRAGKAQIRGMLVEHNREEGFPDCMYATKLVKRPHHKVEHLFMIRVDPATMQPMDIQEVPWKLALTALGDVPDRNGLIPQTSWMDSVVTDSAEKLSATFDQVFHEIAVWHAESFGVGPVAPQGCSVEDEETADVFIRWQEARLKQKTELAQKQPGQSPRL